MRIAEDRLRDGLRELAEEADPNVRAMDVIALVEGRHRQRSIRQLVAACAAVTTAGLLGWFALAPRPVTVQPAPLASAMVRPGTTTGVFGFNTIDPVAHHTVTVRAESSASQVSITVTDEIEGRPDATTHHSYVAPAGQFFTVRVHDDLEVSLIPDPVRAVQTIGRVSGFAQHWTDQQTGFTLTATWLYGIKGATGRLVWIGSDGLVRTARDGVLPSLELTVDGSTFTFFRDTQDDAWGVFDPAHNYWVSQLAPRPAKVDVRTFLSGRRASIGRLPAGASAVTITPTEKARWTVGTMADGTAWYFVLADQEVSYDSSKHRLVRSISYTDGTGKRVTYTPRMEN